MKRILLFFALLLLTTQQSSAQWFSGTENTTSNVSRTGNMAIGTNVTPNEKLVLVGNLNFKYLSDYTIKADINSGVFRLYPSGNSNAGPFMEMYGPTNTDRPGTLALGSYGTNGETWFTHYNTTTNNWEIQAKITPDGKFVIGEVNPNTSGHYGLYVRDGVLTEQVKVAIKSTNDWSDFVFHRNYPLLSLDEVECFIEENAHLPNVPSAEAVVKEGINMAQMDAKLLEKIEELTLYTIELNKQLKAMQQKIANLELQK